MLTAGKNTVDILLAAKDASIKQYREVAEKLEAARDAAIQELATKKKELGTTHRNVELTQLHKQVEELDSEVRTLKKRNQQLFNDNTR